MVLFNALWVISSLVAVATALYSPSDDVIELTASNFDRLVKQSDDLWLVEFYAPWCGHCKQLAPEWKKAASALKGVVKVGAVDMDVHQSVGGPYGIRGFPTLKIFGDNKNSPTDYNGQRSASSIVDSAMKELTNLVKKRLSGGSSSGGRKTGGGGGSKPGDPKDVVELTDSNFETEVLNSKDIVLVEFFAPWCGHCQKLAPEWAKAASELKGKVKVAALDATVHTVSGSRYQVQGYPTIKVFQNGEATDYQGGRTASDIITYALEKLAENVPPPEAYQIINEQVLKDNCEGHQLCVIAILPHILDCPSQCRNDYISILKKEGELFKKNQWGWLWAEAMQQPELEEGLGIGGFGYPALAALNSRKMKFALMKGSFSATGVHDFLRELSFGRGSTAPIKNAKLPNVVAVDAWDGKDGELPVEEDWDLDDVDLEPLESVKKEEL